MSLLSAPDSWCEAMRKLREEGPIIKDIGDLMLARVRREETGPLSHGGRSGGGRHGGQGGDAWAVSLVPQFDGPAREELQQVAAQFCSYQSIALGLIKTKQRKESRFQLFMQVRPRPGG